MNLPLTKVLGDVTGVTGLKILRAIVAGERDPVVLAKLRDRRCKHSLEEIATALDGRYRLEHVTELKLNLTMWEHYQNVIAELDELIAKQLHVMRQQTLLPPLPPKPRVRGKKPHDPRFNVRTALYYLVGIDLTAIEGIDELHALTLISELGTDFTKWPSVKHFTSWLGLCPNWKKTGGKVQSSKTRKDKNRAASELRLAAWSLMRSHSYLGAYLRRQRARLDGIEQLDGDTQAAQAVVEGLPLLLRLRLIGAARPAHPGVDFIFDAIVIGPAHQDAWLTHERTCYFPSARSLTSSRKNGSASVTMPTVWMLPRSMSLVTVAGLMSTQATRTQAGSKLPTAMECSMVATIRQKPT
jgi:hypothetical protein